MSIIVATPRRAHAHDHPLLVRISERMEAGFKNIRDLFAKAIRSEQTSMWNLYRISGSDDSVSPRVVAQLDKLMASEVRTKVK